MHVECTILNKNKCFFFSKCVLSDRVIIVFKSGNPLLSWCIILCYHKTDEPSILDTDHEQFKQRSRRDRCTHNEQYKVLLNVFFPNMLFLDSVILGCKSNNFYPSFRILISNHKTDKLSFLYTDWTIQAEVLNLY